MIFEVILSLFIVVALLGYGGLFEKCFLSSKRVTIAEQLLLGFFSYSFLACFANFFLPLSEWLNFACMLVGGFVFFRKATRAEYSTKDLVLLSALTILFTGFAAGNPMHGDTGLYHFPMIYWHENAAATFGLGNLHSRFAFNSLWFTFSAALKLPYTGMAGPFLSNALLTAAVLFFFVSRFFNKTENQRTRAVCLATFAFFLLDDKFGFGRDMVLKQLSAPSTDLPAGLSLLVAIVLTFDLFISFKSERLVVLVSVLLFSLSIKASQVVSFLLLVPFVLQIRFIPKRAQYVLFSFLLIWTLRGFTYSGCLFYPVTQTCFEQLPWSVDIDATRGTANWIKSYARDSTSYPEKVLASWDWFPQWWKNFSGGANIPWLILSAVVFVFFSVKKTPIQKAVRWILLTSVVGFAVWFFNAPDPRFAFGFFFAAVIFAFGLLIPPQEQLRKIVFALVLGMYLLSGTAETSVRNLFQSGSQFPDLPQMPEYSSATLKSGSAIYFPKQGDRCWNIPLPCAPQSATHIDIHKSGHYWLFSLDR